MAKRILRPLDYGGLFDETFDLYKANFLLFAGIAALVYIPVNLLIAMLKGTGRIMGGEEFAQIFAGLSAGGITILSIPFTYAVMAAITWAVSGAYLDRKPTILGSYKAIRPRIIPFILTVFLVGLAQGIGLLFCCVPGIVLFLMLAFVTEVFVLENKEYVDAMRRSWDLAKGEWVRVLVVVILMGLLTAIIQTVPALPFQFLSEFVKSGPAVTGLLAVLEGLVGGLAQAVGLPIQIIAFVLLYYDIRVRKEGFDIEMLAVSMGEESPS